MWVEIQISTPRMQQWQNVEFNLIFSYTIHENQYTDNIQIVQIYTCVKNIKLTNHFISITKT